MKKRSKIVLFVVTIVVLLLHLFKYNQVPACINADEAAYGYNSFSILKTGKDEYDSSLPARLKSFGDYKLPLYSYLDLPFVAFFGLNETSTRLPAIIIGILFPIILYFLTKKLFEREDISLVAALLASVSPWIQIMSRHAHESLPATFFITLSLTILLYLKEKFALKKIALFFIFLVLSLFSYHFGRIFTIFIFIYFVYLIFFDKRNALFNLEKKIKSILILLFLAIGTIFIVTELKYSPDRISNLIFYNRAGFRLSINQLRGEHQIRTIHNSLTHALNEQSKEYLRYLSPEFLVIKGDENPRFGFPGISPITIAEYLLVLAGFYYLFKKQENNRYLLLFLLLISPISASLSWQSYSINRSFYLIVPILVISSYGFVELYKSLKKERHLWPSWLLVGAYIFTLYMTWDFYFYHYPKRATVITAWQCGYKELAGYIRENYNKFDKFYVTTRHGQPYIFLLYYLAYSPEKYQKQARLSPPDDYGFGQVEKFDKFDFRFNLGEEKEKKVVYIGYPEHFVSRKDVEPGRLKKIKVGTEEIFWIYEN